MIIGPVNTRGGRAVHRRRERVLARGRLELISIGVGWTVANRSLVHDGGQWPLHLARGASASPAR